ncbi:MAG: guanylate kinase, partial [Sphingomicrobium sp.]
FILPPSMAELERRLRARGTDSDAVIAERMERAAAEISHWAEYDYVLINDDMERCLGQVRSIVAAERLKRGRQLGLVDFVRGLGPA